MSLLQYLDSLISFKGKTTADGAGDGSSLEDSVLTTKPDYNGNLVIITSGAYAGQGRDINGTTLLGTVTPSSAFGGQILSGTNFVIVALRLTPAEVAALTAALAAHEASQLVSRGEVTSIETKVDDLGAAMALDATVAKEATVDAGFLAEQDDRAEQTAELIAADMTLVTAFGSGSLLDSVETTLCSLDAIGGTKKDVKVTVYLDADVVAAGIIERWYLTSIAAPATFVLKHPENAQHDPGVACVLTREFGDVPEGLQLEFRILSAGDDTGVGYEVELSYLS